MKISARTSTTGSISIWIDDLLHLFLISRSVVGIHTWIETGLKGIEIEWAIEIHLKTGTVVKTEYDSRDKWVSVLAILQEKLDIQ